MAKPSLKASETGLQLAKQALMRAQWSQKVLSETIGCSRQPVTNFFNGKAIEQTIFIRVCDRLGLDWQAIAGFAEAPGSSVNAAGAVGVGLDALVQSLRQHLHASIEERCGTMRILDMAHPVGINAIYTDVNILEQITGRRHRQLEDLLQELNPDDFDHLGLSQVTEERMPGLDAVQQYHRLILLGKPGAGKTTFLKYLAIQCNQGQFEVQCVPIFVTLREFAEAPNQPNLLSYISRRDSYAQHCVPEADNPWPNSFYQVLAHGRALILLDGLDEVRAEHYTRVLREIREFSKEFRDNHFVMTCRIAAWEYTFEKFTEVEIADFDNEQIAMFAANWFRDKLVKPAALLTSLQTHSRLQELAASPLLLTMLCLTFEETGECPRNRAELYKEGINVLLRKWDAKRGIQRDQVYKNLSYQRKEDLLSQIALMAFKQGDYFFKKQTIEQQITDYIRNLPHANTDLEGLQLDSEAVLHSIEAQHGLLVERAKGIYSFSHLTFQEYFVAKELVFEINRQAETIELLMTHLGDRRWREVFLLITELLRDASLLLLPMQHQIDCLLASEPKLQDFLHYVQQQAELPEFSDFKPAAVRAFHFDIDFEIDQNRSVALHLDRSTSLLVCASFLTRMLDNVSLQQAIAIAQTHDQTLPPDAAKISRATSANAAMLIAIQIALGFKTLKSGDRRTLKTLLQRLKGNELDDQQLKEVADEARDVAKQRHHIGQLWQFTAAEKAILKQYYDANQLLVECLDSDGCMMEPELRQQLEATLFLPNQISA